MQAQSNDKKREKHWDNLFKIIDYTQVLWHQNSPQKSVDFINSYVKNDSSIIDVGCGTSFLVDSLIQIGYKNLTLIDTSITALEIVKSRINDSKVKFNCCDILNFNSDTKYDLWHDRAVLHFLLSKNDREKYFQVLSESLKSKAIAVISTFSTSGPKQCAGLDIIQFNNEKMKNEIPSNLTLINSEEYEHITPKGTKQSYIYFIIQKK